MPAQLKIGCCGFPIARGKYYKKFSVVEVQATFYDFIKPETLKKWRSEAPKDFEFVLKASQFITHPANSPTYKRAKHTKDLKLKDLGNFQPTNEVFRCFKTLIEYAETLKSKVIIFQTPPSFSPEKDNINNMEKFFDKIERKGYTFGWEPRGKWRPEEIKRVCEKLDLIDVVDPFLRESTYGKISYYRLHGGEDYRHKFTDEELKGLAERIKGKEGYVMFNNITSFEDAQRFLKII